MTTPEPVPDWAHEPGLSQVICGCTGEHFVFLISDKAARLVCIRCNAVNGVFQREPDQPLVTFDDIPPMPPGTDLPRIPPPAEVLPPHRDVLGGPGGGGPGATAGVAWGSPGGLPPEPDVFTGGVPDTPDRDNYAVPGLPDMTPANCNVYLRNGPLDGRLTYVPPDVVTYVISGLGAYYRTLEVHEGRTVYLHKG